jgi:hypothetical protein
MLLLQHCRHLSAEMLQLFVIRLYEGAVRAFEAVHDDTSLEREEPELRAGNEGARELLHCRKFGLLLAVMEWSQVLTVHAGVVSLVCVRLPARKSYASLIPLTAPRDVLVFWLCALHRCSDCIVHPVLSSLHTGK